MSIGESIKNSCIVDTSLLSNFVFLGRAHLLQKLIGRPVFISPAVLDPAESLTDVVQRPARSEFLKPLYEISGQADARYAGAAPHIKSFANAVGSLWSAVDLTIDELQLAADLKNRSIWSGLSGLPSKYTKKGLGAGEAEACAIAAKRGWTLLIDDQAAVELMTALGYEIPCIRTCMLLTHAVAIGLISCLDAADLFNGQIVDMFGFNATRNKRTERLWFRCSPEPKCLWEPHSDES